MKYTGIPSDKFYLHEEEIKKMDAMMGKMGMDSVSGPVDINTACVEEKQGNGLSKMSDMEKLQYNIHERFDLCTKEDYEY